jgi:hypothetical protein
MFPKITERRNIKFKGVVDMAKKSRGGRMNAAVIRAKSGAVTGGRPGGKGLVKNRPAGKRIMRT